MDNVEISLKAGKGGNGLASFWREKFQPFGGPDGGDGGKGGDIYLIADINTTDLSKFRHNRSFKAEDGVAGGRQKKHGRDGEDVVIKIPVGTTIYRLEDDNKVFADDLTIDRQKFKAARGGKGGLGNVHFATSTNQAPKQAGPGKVGEQVNLALEYNIPADAAIIGLTNTGKSTLLNKITGAPAKIAEYPFTTTEPVLGRADFSGRLFTIVEIPALMKDSSLGKGLGNAFLRHSLRAKVIILLLDGTSPDIKNELKVLRSELEKYNPVLKEKPVLIAVNKMDLPEAAALEADVKRQFKKEGKQVFFLSAASGEGLEALLAEIVTLLKEEVAPAAAPALQEVVFRPRPMSRKGPR
jgi:GTPase